MVATWRRSRVVAFFGGIMSAPTRCKAWSCVVLGLFLVLAVACGASSDATMDVALTPTVRAGILASSAPTFTSVPTEVPSPTAIRADPYAAQREELVQRTIVDRGVTDAAVIAAMQTVHRHRFVPDEYLDRAYADHPLPIGYGQTISQPYIVALMTELLELDRGDRVLEIGTGSGYQAAVLGEITEEVYTIEIIPELAESAAARLAELGYDNVVATQGDGYFGWEEYAPYDAIIVTAAPDHLPQPLVGQLKDGGYIVVPIGPPGGYQSLWRFTRSGDELKAENLGGVQFVPFTGPGIESGGE
jgi:protein-L-isoaspartate(D-aspartate) O-methyltransferase